MVETFQLLLHAQFRKNGICISHGHRADPSYTMPRYSSTNSVFFEKSIECPTADAKRSGRMSFVLSVTVVGA